MTACHQKNKHAKLANIEEKKKDTIHKLLGYIEVCSK